MFLVVQNQRSVFHPKTSELLLIVDFLYSHYHHCCYKRQTHNPKKKEKKRTDSIFSLFFNLFFFFFEILLWNIWITGVDENCSSTVHRVVLRLLKLSSKINWFMQTFCNFPSLSSTFVIEGVSHFPSLFALTGVPS